MKSYLECQFCHKYFDAHQPDQEITNLDEWRVIPKAPHDLELIEGVAPTTTQEGLKPYYTCKECNAIFEDAEGKIAITGDLHKWRIIPQLEKPIENQIINQK